VDLNARNALEDDLEALATLWHEGWRDAHSGIVPAELERLRTPESFRERMEKALSDVRVVGPPGLPAGFHLVRDAELYQLYVSREARGRGVAAALLADAEARLAASGVLTGWLACAIGNERAARFYEKQGWRRSGTMLNVVETSEGTFSLETWRYEKSLIAPGRSAPP
jgi:ribosomal protein S18 acetylase RimI-like enzyme